MTALVLSAGGLFGAWEVGVWKALEQRFRPDLVVGVSAGALNGWAIASGATAAELAKDWLDPLTADLMRPRLHSRGFWPPDALYVKARELYARGRPVMPFGLTVVQVPLPRVRLVRDSQITWRHLAATCAVPGGYPPVEIDGRLYVDGGLLGALPLWAAEEMGATRVVAVNALTNLPFRLLRGVIRPRKPKGHLDTILIEPSIRLGSLRDAIHWSRDRVQRWIDQGERDANAAALSISVGL